MRKVLSVLLVVVIAWMSGGCSTVMGHYAQKNLNATEIAKAYYDQDKVYKPMEITGLASVTLQAAEGKELTITLSSQLEPLQILPRHPSALQALGDLLLKAGGVAAAAYVGGELVGAVNDPAVVTKEVPVIIRP